MSTEIGVELIRLIPSLLWIILVAVIVAIFRTPLVSRFQDMTGLKMGPTGLEATFIVKELEKAEQANAQTERALPDAISDGPSSAAGEITASNSERSLVARRAERNQIALQGARILWVDDKPNNNYYEQNILRSLGVDIDTALSTREALDTLRRQRYDLVITDQSHPDEPRADLQLISALRDQRHHPPVIVYGATGGLTPDGAFGNTNRPDQLLHLVMDVLERERG